MSEESRLNAAKIIAHYSTYPEKDRFDAALGQLEFVRTCEVLERYLPASGTILDIGGGPGSYARWLIDRGYTVRLLDPVPRHVKEAEEMLAPLVPSGQVRATVGNALDLPYADGRADAALLLGPLYHLSDRSDRLQALRECLRVMKPGTFVFAAGISRFASLLDGLVRRFLWDSVFEGIVRQDLATGQHENPTANVDYFTRGFFHRPDELAEEIREAGFVDVLVLAVEGPLWADRELAEDWQDADRQTTLLELARTVEEEPSLVGASPHILAVAKKPSR